MSFRQHKSDRHIEDRAWREWLAAHSAELKTIGLPPELTASPSHWSDFLQNGYLEWHPESNAGFSFDQLSNEQMSALLAVLEQSPKFATQPLCGWLRHRVG